MRHFLGASPQTPWVRFAKVSNVLLHGILGRFCFLNMIVSWYRNVHSISYFHLFALCIKRFVRLITCMGAMLLSIKLPSQIIC
jgi:hypothetical protein